MERKQLKSIALYVLYGLVAAIAFLYLLFPGETVRDYLAARIVENRPGALVSIDAVGPVFPPGVKIDNLTIGFRKNVDATLHADAVTARLALGKLFSGRTAIHTRAAAYGGALTAETVFNRLFYFRGASRTDLKIENVRIEKCTYLQDALSREITGRLSATGAFQGKPSQWTNGTGKVRFTLRNGIYGLMEPLAGISSFNFSRIEGEATLGGGTLTVDRLELTADNARCSLKGQIVLDQNDFKNSQLSLNGHVEARGGLGNRKIPYALSGPLGNPQLTLQ
jgi:type II secretion system protein N